MNTLNLAGWDRWLRVSVGAALLLSLGVGGAAAWIAVPVSGVGLTLLVTGVSGWCPLYAVREISTAPPPT